MITDIKSDTACKRVNEIGVGEIMSVVSSLVLAILAIPVVGAAFLNVIKAMIGYLIPVDKIKAKIGYKKGTMRFANDKRDHLDVQRYPEELPINNVFTNYIFPAVELIVELADQLAIKYIDGIIMILKKVPKLKNKSDSDLKHISLTIYYTLTVGLIMKLVKLLMLKKGMVGDTAAYKSIRDIITNGLKFGSYDLDFDDMERESDIMFSNKSLAPIVKELTDRVGSMLHIFEDQSVSYRDFYKDLLLELEFNVAPYSEHPHGFIGWKGKMVWMSPDKFLSLARKLDFPYEDSLNSLRNAMKDGKSIPHLMLGVDMVKRKVIDHEGRHRATVAKELGIEKVPVFIYTGNYTRTPSWTKEDHDVVDNLKFDREG